MQEKEISQAVIRRMPRYYRYLGGGWSGTYFIQ